MVATNGHYTNGTVLIDPPKQYQAEQLPPHDVDAEEALLGALLIDQDTMIDVSYLEPTDFYIGKHGWLYDAIRHLTDNGTPPDLVTVANLLEKRGKLDDLGGPMFLTDLTQRTPTSMHAAHYARIVYFASMQRQTIKAARSITQLAYSPQGDIVDADDLVGQAIDDLLQIDTSRRQGGGLRAVEAVADKYLDMAQFAHENKGQTGLPCSIKAVNSILGGYQAGKLYLLAARPGMGKSGLAAGEALHLAKQGKRVLFFALEMPEEDVFARLVAAQSGVSLEKVSTGQLDDKEWTQISQAAAIISALPIYIDEQPAQRMATLRGRATRQIAKTGADIIIVDHFGQVRSDNRQGKQYEIASDISDQALALAKELHIPVIGLLQLSRAVESRHDKRPLLADLRDSGKWEENAHAVLYIYRDGYYKEDTEFPHMADIIIAKNRNGRTGKASAFWRKETTQFKDIHLGDV